MQTLILILNIDSVVEGCVLFIIWGNRHDQKSD